MGQQMFCHSFFIEASHLVILLKNQFQYFKSLRTTNLLQIVVNQFVFNNYIRRDQRHYCNTKIIDDYLNDNNLRTQ